MLAWQFDVEVDAGEYTELYIGSSYYGHLYSMGSSSHWQATSGMFIRVLLFEYLATIGALDLGYVEAHEADIGLEYYSYGPLSLHDGILYFRITPLGAFLLGQADAYEMKHADAALFAIDGTLTMH